LHFLSIIREIVTRLFCQHYVLDQPPKSILPLQLRLLCILPQLRRSRLHARHLRALLLQIRSPQCSTNLIREREEDRYERDKLEEGRDRAERGVWADVFLGVGIAVLLGPLFELKVAGVGGWEGLVNGHMEGG
jgi:hypothetical protein